MKLVYKPYPSEINLISLYPEHSEPVGIHFDGVDDVVAGIAKFNEISQNPFLSKQTSEFDETLRLQGLLIDVLAKDSNPGEFFFIPPKGSRLPGSLVASRGNVLAEVVDQKTQIRLLGAFAIGESNRRMDVDPIYPYGKERNILDITRMENLNISIKRYRKD